MNSSMVEYDFVVIGAGMSGLCFAALAAQQGKRVFVAEQHYLPGGCLTAFKSGSYTFNVAFEWTTDCAPGQLLHTILKDLEVIEDYPFKRVDVFKTVVFADASRRVIFPTKAERLRLSLCQSFPEQEREIDRFLDDCVQVACNGPRGKAVLLRHGIKPIEQMLADYFIDPVLQHALYGLLGYPAARGVLLMYIVGAVASDEIWVPIHRDHRRLSSLFYRRIKSMGGHVALSTTVNKILIDNECAAGIRLADGRVVRARHVVATTDPQQLYSKLIPRDVSEADRPTGSPGLSCFNVFLGLKQPVRSPASVGSAYALLADQDAWQADPNGLSGIPLRFELQSAEYPGLAPKGHSTLCVWGATPISAFDYWGQGRDEEYEEINRHSYANARARAAEIVLSRVERVMPGIRKNIAVMETATPFTYKRYTKALAGSVSGFSLTDISYLKERPHHTPIKGLFHIGHWTTQSGVNSAMYSAASLAKSLL